MIISDALTVRKTHNFLMKSQYWPREDIERYQNLKLRALIKNSYENVPYYHDMFRRLDLKPDDIKTKEDLHKLPIMTKDDLRQNLDKMLARNLRSRAMPSQTGGSTGEPLKFYVQREMWAWANGARYRGWNWAHYNFRDRMVDLWGASFEIEQLEKMSTKIRHSLLRRLMLNAFKMSDEDMSQYARQIIQFKPNILRSFSGAMYVFAKYVSDNNIKGIEPQAIITTAENLYDFQRKKIEDTFGCRVYDGYGSRETSLIAHECEHLQGYHISDENSIVEFLKDGEPVSPGESGNIIITDLHNQVMPWLRYSIGDMGTPKMEKCGCGRSLSMMSSIDGRVHDFIVTPSGQRLPGEFFPHLFKDVSGIQEYRIIQKKIDKLEIDIVRTSEFTDTDIQYLLKYLREYLGDDIDIDVKYPDKIDWPESGKRRYTISEVA